MPIFINLSREIDYIDRNSWIYINTRFNYFMLIYLSFMGKAVLEVNAKTLIVKTENHKT